MNMCAIFTTHSKSVIF